MRKTLLLFAFSLFLIMAVGCTSEDSEKSEKANPSGANVPVPPTPNAQLLTVQGSCKINKVGPEDSAAGTVKMDGPTKGEFEGCGVLPPNRGGMVAFQARIIANVPGRPTLRVVSPGQVGVSECVLAKPTGVNYVPDTSNADSVVYVTKATANSTCKVETTTYDAHHWKGKLTANLLPSKPDQGNTIVPVKAEWDLYF
jgi:hypothetical protein